MIHEQKELSVDSMIRSCMDNLTPAKRGPDRDGGVEDCGFTECGLRNVLIQTADDLQRETTQAASSVQ